MQLDMFFSSPSGSALYGKTTTADWLPPCDCGSRQVVIGSSSGPHEARLICTGCTRWRAWLSAQRAAALRQSMGAL